MAADVLVKNAWYVAGLSHEFAPQQLQGQVIAEKPLVLWRTAEGSVVAFDERCDHKRMPLSQGRFVEGVYSSAPITACATMRLVSASGYRRTPTATSCKELGCARFRSSSKTVSSGSGRESQGGDGPAAAHSGDRRSGMGNGRHRADAGARQHCVADRKPARHQPFLPAARRQYRR